MVNANDCGAALDPVVRTGKFFEVDREFVDRSGIRFGISAAEADERIARFQPRPINLQHVPTIFDGLLGQVRRLWREGADICAEFEIPRWLSDLTGGRPLKVSSEWDPATKEPIGAALVLEPALADAVILAAFSAGGPISRRSSRTTEEEANLIQMYDSNLITKLRALLAGAGTADAPAEPVQFGAPAVELSTPDTAELTRQVALLSAAARQAEASEFAERMVRELRAVPAEKPALIAAYARASEDDALHGGIAQFAVPGAEPIAASRVETLKALYAARPAHAMTAELLRDALAVALAGSQELTALFARSTTPDPAADKPLDEARRRTLHEMTALGHSTLRSA